MYFLHGVIINTGAAQKGPIRGAVKAVGHDVRAVLAQRGTRHEGA